MTICVRLWLSCVVALVLIPGIVLAQDDIDDAPIHYNQSKTTDAVAQLKAKLETGEVKLAWDDKHGWLPALMEQLDVSKESQVLVFSKTSLQNTKIAPGRPRALYYSDDVYMGTVQRGDLIELSAVDNRLGAIFYAIEQTESDRPRIIREDSKCLSCHHTRRTRDVPGYLVRSVFAQSSGHPRFDLGSTTTDTTSDFSERFGGWYVTGTHGKMQHRGNGVVAAEGDDWVEPDRMQNVTDLSDRFDTDRYVSPHSDLIALMVLEHQSQLHNAITSATYEALRADHYDKTWGKILDKPPGYRFDVSKRRIESAGDELLACLLFADEFELKSPIAGTSNFAQAFAKRGPSDQLGRSLREFDLEQRLFKYPCSYLIYSDSFASLPPEMHKYVMDRLKAVLNGDDSSKDFDHLSAEDRQTIREILVDTLSEFD